MTTPRRGYAPILKAIVRACAGTKRRKLCFDALHALRQLAEPDDYFLGLMRGHEDSEDPAYFAVLVLARSPSGGLMAELARIQDEADPRARIQGAIEHAKAVWLTAQHYHATESVEERADILLSDVARVCGSEGVDEYDPHSHLSALSEWSRRELYVLSMDWPQRVARRILARPLSPSQRAYVVASSHETCRRALAELKRSQ